MDKSVLIVGVGGQGNILASRLMGAVLMKKGLDVKVSEVHGMSQRGGSVVTYVKWGKEVASPIIEEAEADMVIAFEMLEAARWLPCLKEGGRLIVSSQEIDPMPVITGAAEYPKELDRKLREKNIQIHRLDGLQMALEAGSAKAVNVVLMGVAARYLDFPLSLWEEAIRETIPERFLQLNRKAFELGYKA